jgi:nitrate/nitrite-specific signal transduction histidine kinase
MAERAQRIGADLEFISTLQNGSSVIVTLPSSQTAAL